MYIYVRGHFERRDTGQGFLFFKHRENVQILQSVWTEAAQFSLSCINVKIYLSFILLHAAEIEAAVEYLSKNK